MKKEMRFAGSGGQGVILASIIFADAALRDGKYAIQSQSYGPEARGGMCKAETIISDDKINFPKVLNTDFLLALTQGSLEKYMTAANENSIIMADASLNVTKGMCKGKIVTVPILKTASETLKKAMTANIVAVGAINTYLKLLSDDAVEEAVLARVPKGTEDLNRQALQAGRKIVETDLIEI